MPKTLKNMDTIPLRQTSVADMRAEMTRLQQQVRQQQALITALERSSVTDVLTGLLNRRGFEQALQKHYNSFQRYGHKAALLMLDVDDFKSINDSLGHAAGDQALQHVARLLQQHVRASDIVARLGGDEFCVILLEVDAATAQKKASQLQHIIEHQPCPWQQREICLRVSLGVETFENAGSRQKLYQAADRAMYAQKQQPRNA